MEYLASSKKKSLTGSTLFYSNNKQNYNSLNDTNTIFTLLCLRYIIVHETKDAARPAPVIPMMPAPIPAQHAHRRFPAFSS
jgi:hypothetical protein